VQLENLANGFPDVDISMKSSSKIIYYQNVCTHSYSFTWWDENDWRKHIDWIALSGITLTLAPFQEDIWAEIYQEFGMNEQQVEEDLAGPGFFAWQRMGNMRGWGGPLTSNFTQRASRVQKYMIEQLNNLGISVALPAFDGHLPVQFKKLFPSAGFSSVDRWNEFPDKYCCPLFLDPVDPLFKFIGERFIEKIVGKYGTNHIYFSDPFNEVQPRLAEPEYLANVSQGIYAAMSSFDDDAVWLLQGWMFVKNPFWKDDLIEAFLTAVPKVVF
jgi:alpha-N-acetylglucosaminidase